MKKQLFIVSVCDHSSLGGPMGSDDSTPLLSRTFFLDREKMWLYIDRLLKKNLKRRRYEEIKKLSRRQMTKEMADFGHIGITIDRAKIHE